MDQNSAGAYIMWVADPHIDKVVFMWFVKERYDSTEFSGYILSIQAQKLHKNLHVDIPSDFIASKGWLHRIGINQVKMVKQDQQNNCHQWVCSILKIRSILVLDKIDNADNLAL